MALKKKDDTKPTLIFLCKPPETCFTTPWIQTLQVSPKCEILITDTQKALIKKKIKVQTNTVTYVRAKASSF